MKTIMIVEDQPDVQRLLGLYLSAPERQIVHAYDALEAWQILQVEPPELILLDIMMPGEMDGVGLLRQMRQDPRYQETKVIVISALTQNSDKEKAYSAGADDFISKPFRLEDLKQRIDRWLDLLPCS